MATLDHTSALARWPGAKTRMARAIAALLEQIPHRGYCEPFAGTLAVLRTKTRVRCEVAGDADGVLVTVLKTMQDPTSARQLARLIAGTPYAERVYQEAFEVDLATLEPLEMTLNFLIRTTMGQRSKGYWKNSGFDARINEDFFLARVELWQSYPERLRHFCARLKGVVLLNRSAERTLSTVDRDGFLHYLDPPYFGSNKQYQRGFCARDHEALLRQAVALKGHVVISHYDNPLYRQLLEPHGFEQRSLGSAWADGAHEREEFVWLSPSAITALGWGAQGRMF